MPLRDHFRPPISRSHAWESFHARWAAEIMDDLNRRLPSRFLAEMQVHLGRRVEADVVEFDLERHADDAAASNGTVGVATKPVVYAPPEPVLTVPVTFDDAIEVRVHDQARDRRVVAVIELVSPANKDRPEERETFALKSLGHLKAGVGLVIADIVTDRHFNLHDEVIRLARAADANRMPGSPATYAVGYRPVHRDGRNLLDVWPTELAAGGQLPTVPLALKGFGCVPLDLEATYAEACEQSRIT